MSNKIIQNISKTFQLELPECDSMDEYLDAILPKINNWNEPLSKLGFLNKRWLEVKDDEEFKDNILHIFCEDHEYLISIEGNILKGTWRTLSDENTLIFEMGGRKELYDCVFNHPDYFILKKHGNQQRKGFNKYFFLGKESNVANSDWTDVMQSLYSLYSNNTKFMIYLVGIALAIIIILYFSLM